METPTKPDDYSAFILVKLVSKEIITIQSMSWSHKAAVNGYRWMRKAQIEWLDFDTFRARYGNHGRDMILSYDKRWVTHVYGS